MNKFFLLLGSALISLNVYAATGVTLSVAPQQPAVFKGDIQVDNGPLVKGPWFSPQFFFNTDTEAFVTSIELKVTSQEGRTTVYGFVLPNSIYIVPGTTAHTEILYFGSLPTSANYTYDVEVRFHGSYAPAKPGDPSERLDLVGNFKTQ